MAGFSLEKNVPNYYVNESRDFQLLCRIIDVYLKGCLSKSSYIPYQLDLDKCDEQLLYAIANMQGFTTKKYIPPNILRNILKVFPYCIKRKGTQEAIELASYAVLSTDRLIYYIRVQVNAFSISEDSEGYTILITCNSQSEYIPYLEEVLSFLIPPGWKITYQLADIVMEEANPVKITTSSKTSRISGITGKLLTAYPLLIESFGPNASPSIVKNGMYSKIGIAKIISSRSKEELVGQTGYVNTDNKSQPLLDINDINNVQTVFIGSNVELKSKDNSEGGN